MYENKTCVKHEINIDFFIIILILLLFIFFNFSPLKRVEQNYKNDKGEAEQICGKNYQKII